MPNKLTAEQKEFLNNIGCIKNLKPLTEPLRILGLSLFGTQKKLTDALLFEADVRLELRKRSQELRIKYIKSEADKRAKKYKQEQRTRGERQAVDLAISCARASLIYITGVINDMNLFISTLEPTNNAKTAAIMTAYTAHAYVDMIVSELESSLDENWMNRCYMKLHTGNIFNNALKVYSAYPKDMDRTYFNISCVPKAMRWSGEEVDAFNPQTVLEYITPEGISTFGAQVLGAYKCKLITKWNKRCGFLPNRWVISKYNTYGQKLDNDYTTWCATCYKFVSSPDMNDGIVCRKHKYNKFDSHITTNHFKDLKMLEQHRCVDKDVYYCHKCDRSTRVLKPQRGASGPRLSCCEHTKTRPPLDSLGRNSKHLSIIRKNCHAMVTFEVDNYLNLYDPETKIYLCFNKTPFPLGAFTCPISFSTKRHAHSNSHSSFYGWEHKAVTSWQRLTDIVTNTAASGPEGLVALHGNGISRCRPMSDLIPKNYKEEHDKYNTLTQSLLKLYNHVP